MKKAHL